MTNCPEMYRRHSARRYHVVGEDPRRAKAAARAVVAEPARDVRWTEQKVSPLRGRLGATLGDLHEATWQLAPRQWVAMRVQLTRQMCLPQPPPRCGRSAQHYPPAGGAPLKPIPWPVPPSWRAATQMGQVANQPPDPSHLSCPTTHWCRAY